MVKAALRRSAVTCSLISDDIILHDQPAMLSYQERVDDTLLGHLPDLSLTEAVDGGNLSMPAVRNWPGSLSHMALPD
jgi:hypothetical protein